MKSSTSGTVLNRRNFIALLVGITFLRFLLVYWIPIKNDEAYYVVWARNLDDGYYDHPPLIGWLLWFMSYFSQSIVWYRMVALVAGLVATWGVYSLSERYWGKENARLAALLFALSPSSVWLVFISNDAPLLILLVLSVVSFHKAITESNYLFSWLSGILLGLAFLTKYLAVITGFGFLIFALLDNRKKRLRHLLLVLAGVLPFAIQHINYNYHNCWNTVNFHLFVRNADTSMDIGNFAGYLLELVLVLTPWGLWYLYRNKDRLPVHKKNLPLILALSAIAIFGLISFKSIIGLHFLLIFSPFVFAMYGAIAGYNSQRKLLMFSSVYGLVLVSILFGILMYPLQKLEGWDQHSNFVVGLAPEKVCPELDRYASTPIFTNYYAYSGILSYTCKRDIQVLFGGSKYGRQMDVVLDVRNLDGKDLAILELGTLKPEEYSTYFRNYRIEQFEVLNAPFTVLVGRGFDYEKYRNVILKRTSDQYFSPPGWLPSGGCPFTERYFPEEAR